jgi:hypothetical protein
MRREKKKEEDSVERGDGGKGIDKPSSEVT